MPRLGDQCGLLQCCHGALQLCRQLFDVLRVLRSRRLQFRDLLLQECLIRSAAGILPGEHRDRSGNNGSDMRQNGLECGEKPDSHMHALGAVPNHGYRKYYRTLRTVTSRSSSYDVRWVHVLAQPLTRRTPRTPKKETPVLATGVFLQRDIARYPNRRRRARGPCRMPTRNAFGGH